MTIGEHFRALRRSARLSLKSVSSHSGVSSAAIARFETNQTSIRLDNFVAICVSIQVDPTVLIHEHYPLRISALK